MLLSGAAFHDTPPTQNYDRLRSIFLMGAVLNAEGANHNIIQNNTFTHVTKGIQSTGQFTGSGYVQAGRFAIIHHCLGQGP